MLVNKETKIHENDIISVKMKSGEELLGKLVELRDSELVIQNPLILIVTENNQLNAGAMFISQEKTTVVRLNRDSIIGYCKTSDNLKNQYIQMNSGIDLSTPSNFNPNPES